MGRRLKRKPGSAINTGGELANALFAATQFKVLQLLFAHPERSYFASELISLVGAGSGAVQREVASLVSSGLVTEQQVGRQRHFKANPKSPIFEELRGIIIKTAGIPEAIGKALKPLSKRIALALVFGSIAKGTAKASSDVDVLVVGDGIMLEELYSAFEPPEMALRRKINPTLFSLKEFSRRRADRNAFLTKVLAGEKVIVCGSLNATDSAG